MRIDDAQEEIIGTLLEREAGAATVHSGRKQGLSAAAFYKDKARFCCMTVSDAGGGTAKLKRLLAEEKPAIPAGQVDEPESRTSAASLSAASSSAAVVSAIRRQNRGGALHDPQCRLLGGVHLQSS